jgi:hypothetical protein
LPDDERRRIVRTNSWSRTLVRAARTLLLAAGIALGGSAGVIAHERLRVDDDTPLAWPNPAAVGIVISSAGSADLPDKSHETALRMAIQDWNAVSGSDLTLVEDTSPAQQARTDWEADNIHLILFDETNESGYFGGGGIVAITPVWYFLNGKIADADVLFNGAEFQFTTSGQPGRFDVGDVGAHELGHLLGLDHSGWAGATMYPYVDPAVVLHRSLSLDELRGARDIFPSTAWGSISGTVRRSSDASVVVGAHVVARDADGRTAGSVLTRADGAFTIPGLEAGSYTVYADPLDAPVSSANLGSATVETDFETTFAGAPVVVTGAGDVALGTLTVGPDVTVSLGSNLDDYPLRAIQGMSVMHTVRGVQLLVGSTLSASDPDLVLSAVTWFGNSVMFTVTVPVGEPTGHVDLAVTTALGPKGGGTVLTITGTGFLPDARVVIGDRIYRDGEPGGCAVVDPTTITLTTLPTEAGVHDVVVVDASGLDARLPDGFQATALPTLTTVFPPAGDSAGGTELVLTGTDFVDGLAVRIDGVTQPSVVVDDPTRARVVTAAGTPGGPYVLELENPGGGLSTSAFVYVAQPDPAIAAVTPGVVSKNGGDVVTVSGSNFTADTTVVFGADPDTGLGGTPAAAVVFVDASTLAVTTPAHAKGSFAVLARDASSQQASTLSGFQFTGSGGGGGGGGCAAAPFAPPAGGADGPRAVALGGWWIALLAAATLGMRRRLLAPARVR